MNLVSISWLFRIYCSISLWFHYIEVQNLNSMIQNQIINRNSNRFVTICWRNIVKVCCQCVTDLCRKWSVFSLCVGNSSLRSMIRCKNLQRQSQDKLRRRILILKRSGNWFFIPLSRWMQCMLFNVVIYEFSLTVTGGTSVLKKSYSSNSLWLRQYKEYLIQKLQ